MSKNLKPQIHIYFPEASNRGRKIDLCEHFYIKYSFQRKITKAKIVPYAEDNEEDFEKAIKAKSKKNSIFKNDLFFIVLDTDIKPNRENVGVVITQISALNRKYRDAKIILSGRSFEVWLCMYGRQQYNTPFSDQDKLNSDVLGINRYEKKEIWYRQNADRLYDDYLTAKDASILSKQNVYQSTPMPPPSGYDLVRENPDFSNHSVVSYLVNATPFTYFEQLIAVLTSYE
ncbi:hypothetical protein ACQKII_14475 [Lysinibacillus sp. NPDC048646]|uniref:hypothetical protein n=1 Tax=Lysinibacillus sp. NPDC048646 TaxID=3390574 RepID=UPI003D0036AA